MKAIQINKPGDISPIDIPQPVLKAGEVLIKVCYAGFCGSDLNTYRGGNALAKMPVIPGHEIGGVIVDVGSNVSDSQLNENFSIGLPCTVNPYTACGTCSSCRNGRPNACRFNQTLGVQRDGAMCEYIAVPREKVIADPEISPKDFCLVEPLSVGFHAVRRGEVTVHDVVMVIGCGMIGIGAIAGAIQRGASVIAVDIDDNKLLLAKQLGATYTINSLTNNVHDRLQTITENTGSDVVIEAVGSPATYQMAVNEVAFTGRVVCIGYAKEQVAFETRYFVQKELDIRGSRNAMPEDFRAVMEYLKKGDCPVEKFISAIYPPAQVVEAFRHWTANPARTLKILIEFASTDN
ncbi:MAG: zinc-binding alcohol dehydrogenase family protein [Tannerella sp.]|jgi:threonine dehydrogenase-like Zn-dependent dehydrogenase|nr:zinc-binding alcohol dehydrogenase family protein [Tannerella sp.]